MSALAVSHSTRDNQRFMPVPLRDPEPEPAKADGRKFRVRPMYIKELADWYGESVHRFKLYYLNIEETLPKLSRLGYTPGKTRQLSVGMIRHIIDVHGRPDED